MLAFFKQIKSIPVRLELPYEDFNYYQASHLQFLKNRLARFKHFQSNLQTFDFKCAVAWMTGCLVLLAGPHSRAQVVICILATWYVTNGTHLRPDFFIPYKESLEDLIEAYHWSMGKETGQHREKIRHTCIQELIMTLGPWVSTKTICTWDKADLEPQPSLISSILALVDKKEKELPKELKLAMLDFAAGKQTKNWLFRVYGEHGQGDWWTLFTTMKENFINQVPAVDLALTAIHHRQC